MDNTSQNIPSILEYHWYWRSQWTEWLIMESYVMMNSKISDIWSRIQTVTVSNVYKIQVCTIWIQVSCVIFCWWLCILVHIWGTNKLVCGYTFKEIKNIINNQTFLMDEPEKGEPATWCMDVYKAKIKSDGNIDKLKFIIVVTFIISKKLETPGIQQHQWVI